MSKKKIQKAKGRGGPQQGRSVSAVAPKLAQKRKRKPNKNAGAGGAALQDVPLTGHSGDSDASDLDVSDEDLEFVEKHRNRLTFLEKLDQRELDKSIRAKQERQANEAAEARQRAAAAAAGVEDGSGSEGGDEDGDAEDGEDGAGGDKAEEDDDEDDAAAYERAPRRIKTDPRDHAGAGLPVKTLTGDVVYDKMDEQAGSEEARGRRKAAAQAAAAGGSRRQAEMEAALAAAAAIQVEGVTITDDLEAALAASKRKAEEEAERKAKEAAKKAAAAARKAEEAALPPALRGLQLASLSAAERRSKLQEVMAAAAQKLLAAPESCVGELKTLQALVSDSDSMTSRLALLSLLAVFKDILPGYRIRPPSEREMEVKVSKEVAKLREYEQTLLKSYQTYLRSLLDAAQCVQRGTGTLSHSRVAVRCLTGLLAAHPHFNYTSDILQAVVPRMASSDPETRLLCGEAVRVLLEGADRGADEGGAGKAALEAVQLIADLVRTRKCVVPPEVVRTLSVLRFRDVIPPGRGEEDEGEEGGKRRKGRKAEKRDAKRRRKEDDVSRAFKESAAGPDAAELARLQSSMLEALFEIYFRVLKHCSSVGISASAQLRQQQGQRQGPRAADGEVEVEVEGAGPRVPTASLTPPWSRARLIRKCPLLHPVLDGLAKYTHLISVDYLNDLLAVFSDLLAAPALPLPERLRLLATLATLLRGQGEALNVDRRELYVQLYDTLLQVPFQSLLTDEPPANHQRPQPPSQSNGAVQPNDDDDADGDDADIAMAAASDQAAEDAATPPPQAAAAAAGEVAASAPSVAELLAVVLEALLCEPKMADMQRTAAFVKRMAGIALLAGPGEAMALWAAIGRLLRRYPKLANMLEYEGEAPTVGGRTYDPFCTDPSEAGGLSTTLWEVCLASGGHPHYQPHLAQAAASLLALRPGAAAAAAAAAAGGGGGGGGAIHLTGPLGTPATITELAKAYDASRGLMRPPPPPPAAGAAAGGGRKGKGGRRGAGGVAAAAAPSAEFLEAVAELAAEYGSGSGASSGGWDDLDLDSELDADAVGAPGDDVDDDQADGDDGDDGDVMEYGTGRAANGGARSDRLCGGGEAAAAAAAALRRMFLESRRFELNRQLRRDKALLVESLKRFHIHLQQRQVAAAAAAAAPAAKPVARSAGGKPVAKEPVPAGPQPQLQPQPQPQPKSQAPPGKKGAVQLQAPAANHQAQKQPQPQQQQPGEQSQKGRGKGKGKGKPTRVATEPVSEQPQQPQQPQRRGRQPTQLQTGGEAATGGKKQRGR